MSNQPSLIAYRVIERGKGKKAVWHRIGAAWRHKDGDGFSIQLDSLPPDGAIVLIPPKDEADSNGAEG